MRCARQCRQVCTWSHLLYLMCAILGCAPRIFAAGVPIESISLGTLDGYSVTASPDSGIEALGFPEFFTFVGGGGWESGAGSTTVNYAAETAVSVNGSLMSYVLSTPPGSLIYSETDYDLGSNSSNGQLVSTAPLILNAYVGSTTATLDGYAMISVDTPANYSDDRFHYFDAPIGAFVPFSLTYTLTSGTWTPTIMDSPFSYNMSGTLDFSDAVPEPSPSLVSLIVIALWLYRRRRGHQHPHIFVSRLGLDKARAHERGAASILHRIGEIHLKTQLRVLLMSRWLHSTCCARSWQAGFCIKGRFVA
jgi:hypothetical protein